MVAQRAPFVWSLIRIFGTTRRVIAVWNVYLALDYGLVACVQQGILLHHLRRGAEWLRDENDEIGGQCDVKRGRPSGGIVQQSRGSVANLARCVSPCARMAERNSASDLRLNSSIALRPTFRS